MVFDVVAVGNINVDLSFSVAKMPSRDSEVFSDDFIISYGGSAANFAYAAARLGLKVAIIGCVGDDPFGIMSIKELEGEGVDCSRVEVEKGMRTGTVCVFVDKLGGRRMVAYRGANEILPKAVGKGIPPARAVHMSNVTRGVMEGVLGAGHDGLISLDPGGQARGLGMAQMEGVDLILLNELECRHLTAMPLRQGVDALIRRVRMVVVKRGSRGAWLARGGALVSQPAFAVPVVDTTGAGDAFDAGFICSLLEGMDDDSCLRFAQAVAALKIGGRGARSCLPPRDETLEFLRSEGNKIKNRLLV